MITIPLLRDQIDLWSYLTKLNRHLFLMMLIVAISMISLKSLMSQKVQKNRKMNLLTSNLFFLNDSELDNIIKDKKYNDLTGFKKGCRFVIIVYYYR